MVLRGIDVTVTNRWRWMPGSAPTAAWIRARTGWSSSRDGRSLVKSVDARSFTTQPAATTTTAAQTRDACWDHGLVAAWRPGAGRAGAGRGAGESGDKGPCEDVGNGASGAQASHGSDCSSGPAAAAVPLEAAAGTDSFSATGASCSCSDRISCSLSTTGPSTSSLQPETRAGSNGPAAVSHQFSCTDTGSTRAGPASRDSVAAGKASASNPGVIAPSASTSPTAWIGARDSAAPHGTQARAKTRTRAHRRTARNPRPAT